MSEKTITGEGLREIALDLADVRKRINDAIAAMTDDQRRAARLHDMPSTLMCEVDALALAADQLDRLAERTDGACVSPYGVCPDHGRTLETLRGWGRGLGAKCKRAECDRVWTYDREGDRCDQKATHRAVGPSPDEPGGTTHSSADLCRWHVEPLIEWGWSVRTIAGTPGSGDLADRVLIERCRDVARRRSGVTAATELITALGYKVREEGSGEVDAYGIYPPITLSLSGPVAAEAMFGYDHGPDVFTWSAGWVHGVVAPSEPMTSWPALVETLALKAGKELPPLVIAASGADGGVEHLAEYFHRMITPIIEAGYATAFTGDPQSEINAKWTGYGRTYEALFRHDTALGTLTFAGGWEVDDLVVEAPATWSSLPAFTAALVAVADGAADAID